MNTFHLQIVTPDGLFFDGEAQRVVVRSVVGDVCILAKHTEYLTALGMGKAHILVDDQERCAACIGGLLSVHEGKVRLVATTFEWSNEIDIERARAAKQRAEERLAGQLDERDRRLNEARLKRAIVRLSAVQ